MKTKKIVSLCLTAAMTLSMAAVSAENNNSVTVNINGEAVDFSKYDNVMPYIENDITLIPIRAIAEGLGCEVSWDGENQTVEIKGLNDEILLTVNSSTAVLNNENVTLDVPAQVVDDRTFVPLRFISENMGAKVEWNEEANLITIETERKGGPMGAGNNGFAMGTQGDRQANIETDPEIVSVINEGADKFAQFTFEDEESGISLEYSLYIPEDYDESQEYPMLMYIPDASGASKSAKEIVEQYYGADIWVTDEEQEKHKSFVLVPAFSEIVVEITGIRPRK